MKQNTSSKKIHIKALLGLGIFICISLHAAAGIFDATRDLAKRRVPWLEPHLVFQQLDERAPDRFELSTSGAQVMIKASNSLAAAEGLHWYLKYYCHRSMSHLGDNLAPVSPLPQVKTTVSKQSPFPYRYALNYCTLNYTMAFYQWKDWERELDWMALHGVNTMLMPLGTEKIWQQTLKKFGFSNREIQDFLPGPAFTAWWLMGNLEGWGGPVTQRMIDEQATLGQKILDRMRLLGIEPVLQGFYGMVPRALKQHYPQAHIVDQGKWVGGFDRPSILLPSDPLFHQMADVYYKEIKRLYGADIHYFGGDPFHEGGITQGVDLAEAGKRIQQDMLKSFPRSTWVLQAWQDNPKKDLLKELLKSNVLVLILAGDKSDEWEKRQGYEGAPFIWCTANNFGEKSGVFGKLQFFADEVDRIRKGPYASQFKGVGIVPEGIHNNPVNYDLMLELGWHTQKVQLSNWIEAYIHSRYGAENAHISQAWNTFLQTAYRAGQNKKVGLPEDIFCARPAWDIEKVSTWGSIKKDYDTVLFAQGVQTFFSAYDQMEQSETYLIDLIDLTRQALANKGENVYHQLTEAFKRRDSVQFKQHAHTFISLMSVADSLLSLSSHDRLSTWLDQAHALAKTADEKDIYRRNARAQISIWGPLNNPQTDLHDYANKEWSGMLRTFYIPRWQLFFDKALHELRGKRSAPVDYFSFEKNWVLSKQDLPRVSIQHPQRIFKRALNML